MLSFKTFLFTLLLVLTATELSANHMRAAHITYQETAANTVEITLTTYSDPSAAYVDRCAVDLEIWNSTGTTKIADLTNIRRVNGPWNTDSLYPSNITCLNSQMGQYLIGTLKKNVYKTTFTFSAPGDYRVWYYDVARTNDIVNMANSGSQGLFVETLISINPFSGPQHSPVLLNHPLDFACTGQTWTYNPGGWDADGDSLAYQFTTPKQYDPPSIATPIPCTGYQLPSNVGANGPMTMDPRTGFITWDVPQDQGIYAIAFQVSEYRNGQLISSITVDQIITVSPCTNQPPMITTTTTDTTILAGSTLHLDFAAWDPDSPDSIFFQLNNAGIGLNSAFVASPAATVTLIPASAIPFAGIDTVSGFIEWVTTPALARSAPYQIDLYAQDNLGYYDQPTTQRLSRHHAILVYIVSTLAIAEEQDFTFTLSPNPTQGRFQIQLEKFDEYHISLFDPQGKMIIDDHLKGMAFTYNVENLPNGLYMIKLQSQNGATMARLVVQR